MFTSSPKAMFGLVKNGGPFLIFILHGFITSLISDPTGTEFLVAEGCAIRHQPTSPLSAARFFTKQRAAAALQPVSLGVSAHKNAATLEYRRKYREALTLPFLNTGRTNRPARPSGTLKRACKKK